MKHSLESELLKDNEEFESKMIQQVKPSRIIFDYIFIRILKFATFQLRKKRIQDQTFIFIDLLKNIWVHD